MLEYNEIKERKVILMNGEPYEVVASHVFRKQQRKPVNATKLKNLITGKVMEYSFHQSEKAEEAELSKRKIKFLYENRGEYWFCEEKDSAKRFKMTKEEVGDLIKFVKPNTLVDLISFEERIMGVSVPIKVALKVTEAPPSVKGNTVTGGTKLVTLETGATVDAPLFVNEGDILSINTETGEYVERVNK
ncbi:MAG: elongation factor P [Candidatus Vogelbacteria bacterium]|nr:elongation factor P [Candidatus Vogelbacteria bacterium]